MLYLSQVWSLCLQYPNRKKKQGAASADLEEFSSKFEREFSLIVCLSSCSGSSRVWYIDSGASTHMSEVREVFSKMTERDIDVEVELGDDRVVRVVGRWGQFPFRGSLDLH